jgi:hypothetical protein
MFRPGSTSPDLLEASPATTLQDYHLLWSAFHRLFTLQSGLSAFARRYLRSRGCFPFLRLLRCFSSPGSLPCPMHSDTDDPYGPGFPIRRSQDQSSVTSSPGLIAGSNVLHRLSTPRHPPCALSSLTDPTSTRSRRMRREDGALPISWGRPVRTTRESRREDDHPKTRKKDGPQALGCSRSLGLGVQWSPVCGLDTSAAPALGVGGLNAATSCTSFQRAPVRPKPAGASSGPFPVRWREIGKDSGMARGVNPFGRPKEGFWAPFFEIHLLAGQPEALSVRRFGVDASSARPGGRSPGAGDAVRHPDGAPKWVSNPRRVHRVRGRGYGGRLRRSFGASSARGEDLHATVAPFRA